MSMTASYASIEQITNQYLPRNSRPVSAPSDQGNSFTDILKTEGQYLDVYKFNRKYRDDGKERRGEFDIVISDYKNRTSMVFEVKNSEETDEGQVKNLLSDCFCKTFEEETKTHIIYKAVIYSGKSLKEFGVDYLNAEEFLLRQKGMQIQMPQIRMNNHHITEEESQHSENETDNDIEEEDDDIDPMLKSGDPRWE